MRCLSASPMLLALSLALTVIDGDTLHLGEERLRLLGVDAPELHHCRKGRVCVKGDPVASAENLRRLIQQGHPRIERVGRDRYGRSLVVIHVGRLNISCEQVRGGYAEYVAKWDGGRRIARECPDIAP